MSVSIHTLLTNDQLEAALAGWSALADLSLQHVASSYDLRTQWQIAGNQLIVAISGPIAKPLAMAFFVVGPTLPSALHRRKKAARFEDQGLALAGLCAVVGSFDAAQWSYILGHVADLAAHDILELGEVALGSPLEKAFNGARWPKLRLGRGDKTAHHWSILLPESFQDYLLELRSTTRKSIRYLMRRLEKSADLRIINCSSPDQVDQFLLLGEEISRRTYQWNVGQRLENDNATRDRYRAAADAGTLRCYLLYKGETPIAFSRGTIDSRVFHYETPGFLPAFGKMSPGQLLLAHGIKELIEHKACEVFDFGTGGDLTGYKSRYGTVSVECRNLTLANGRRLMGLMCLLFGSTLSVVKAAARRALKYDATRNVIKALKRNVVAHDDLAEV